MKTCLQFVSFAALALSTTAHAQQQQQQQQSCGQQQQISAEQAARDQAVELVRTQYPRRIETTQALNPGQYLERQLPGFCGTYWVEVVCERPLAGSTQCQQQQDSQISVETLCLGDKLVMGSELVTCSER